MENSENIIKIEIDQPKAEEKVDDPVKPEDQPEEEEFDDGKSYTSLGDKEKDKPNWNAESDHEPPTDEIGDQMTVIEKRQVIKTIVTPAKELGKPGRPYVAVVSIVAFFAPRGKRVKKR